MDEQESRMFPDNFKIKIFKTVFTFCFLQLSYPQSTKYVNKRADGVGGGGGESSVSRPGMVRGEVRAGRFERIS